VYMRSLFIFLVSLSSIFLPFIKSRHKDQVFGKSSGFLLVILSLSRPFFSFKF